MSQPVYRYLEDGDVEQMVDVLARSRSGLPYERRLTPAELRGYIFSDPDYRREGLLAVLLDDELIGIGSSNIEKSRLDAGKNDGVIDVEVVPEHRGRGIERELVDRGLERLRSNGIGFARARVETANDWKTALFTSYSFKEHYRIVDLSRAGREVPPPAPLTAGLAIEHKMFKELSDAEVAEMNRLIDSSFVDHFNWTPHPPERMIAWRDVAVDIMMFAVARKGSEPVGVCLVEDSARYNAERETHEGWVNLLGVLPEHRKKGIGRALLLDGMNWLLGRGMDTINISVVADNEKALDLYCSLGFEKKTAAVWYIRPTSP